MKAAEWYDGPRAGIADINGMPHRFKSLFDEGEGEYLGTFMVWPVDKRVVDLEIEQWCIFVDSNALYESGHADTDSHPGHGGRNARLEEIESQLKQSRSNVPASAKRARAEVTRIDRTSIRAVRAMLHDELEYSVIRLLPQSGLTQRSSRRAAR